VRALNFDNHPELMKGVRIYKRGKRIAWTSPMERGGQKRTFQRLVILMSRVFSCAEFWAADGEQETISDGPNQLDRGKTGRL